jgi:hypothetical protein
LCDVGVERGSSWVGSCSGPERWAGELDELLRRWFVGLGLSVA